MLYIIHKRDKNTFRKLLLNYDFDLFISNFDKTDEANIYDVKCTRRPFMLHDCEENNSLVTTSNCVDS